MQFPASFGHAMRLLGGAEFVRLPRGVQLQLRDTTLGHAVTCSVHMRRVFTYFDKPEQPLVVHGDALSEALDGVLPAMNTVLLSYFHSGHGPGPGWHEVHVRRWHSGKCGVLTVKPSTDPAFSETGDPYTLSKHDSVTLTKTPFSVTGTRWAPPSCRRTDDCTCSWCEAIKARRSAGIAAVLAQFMGPAAK